MRIFLSAGEPSGDHHGANLIRALRRQHPDAEFVGFGGDLMREAGCRLLFPLTGLAVMWFLRVLLNLRVFLRLLKQADDCFRDERPDAVVLIDYPGFNWNVAKRAHARGIPVFYFVAPQLWAWAGWRVAKMRRWVSHVLCSLPFEEQWYRSRGVSAEYVGHPYFDELPDRPDAAFLARHAASPSPVVGLLPGSRDQEIERNLTTLVEAARRVHAARPDVRFLVACLRPDQAEAVRARTAECGLPLEVCSGKTPEVMRLAHACVAVSGSVSLELMYHQKPTVIVYRVSRLARRVGRLFMTCRYITLVNLLADRELFPEYLTDRCEAEAVAGHLLRWLNEPEEYEAVRRELGELAGRVARPGASERAAAAILSRVTGTPLAA